MSILSLMAWSSKDAQCRSSPMSAFAQEGEGDGKVVIPVLRVQKAPQESWPAPH